MKKIFVIFACFYVVLLPMSSTGSSKITDSEISIVKNGTLEIDKSLTVGNAIDNYKYFKNTKWELIKTDNGRKIVEAIGNIDTKKHNKLNMINNIKIAYLKFQFKLNLDNTFDVASCGSYIETSDGTKKETNIHTNIENCLITLKKIYDDEEFK